MKYRSEFKHGFTNPEAVARKCSVKKVFLKISKNSQGNTCNTCRPQAYNFIEKETLTQVFSCEFCKISKKTFFPKTSPVAASPNLGYLYCAILKALHGF